jgi:hypothetical protein
MINWVKMIRCTLDKIELDFRDYDFVNLIKLQKKKKKHTSILMKLRQQIKGENW